MLDRICIEFNDDSDDVGMTANFHEFGVFFRYFRVDLGGNSVVTWDITETEQIKIFLKRHVFKSGI